MSRATVSDTFSIELPSEAREALGVEPGHAVDVRVCGGRVEIVPLESIESMRGFLRGIDTDVPREPDREL
jgi:AbrB family looped-hinge helix DNA binding protein